MNSGIADIAEVRPGEPIGNDRFEAIGLTDEWIRRRTGITARHWLADGSLAELAAAACAPVIERAADATAIGALLVISTSARQRIPAMAQDVAQRAGLTGSVMALDLNAACCGFVFGLVNALSLCDSGRVGSVLVCTAEAMSTVVDRTDRKTACLFGDGAAAMLVEARADFRPFHCVAGGDGTGADLLREDPAGGIQLDGIGVFHRAVQKMSESARRLFDFDPKPSVLVGHQANGRILEQIRLHTADLGVPFVNRIEHSANTSSASISLALADEFQAGALPPRGRLGAVAYGAGESWGGVSVDYDLRRATESRAG
ncbi:3-oxoacyl-ACP synthase III family protein [Nocardia crassostreae]|uniref:3-oxoacyl-ACP synthase III family protein n=1 Tax=Nocardia crassostreae TaxID=53428 RepID=UPI000836373E|nr:3-oxoacyl-[acyl-carrier-protein] synthase III C-terminal domain-containing protein [Nocardia crassostreae]